MALWLVVTTVETREQARTIARAAVESRLAACAQIGAIESIYRWQGELRQEDEYRVVLKTSEAGHEALMAVVRSSHPYELPAVWAIAADAVDGAFADWVTDNASGLPADEGEERPPPAG